MKLNDEAVAVAVLAIWLWPHVVASPILWIAVGGSRRGKKTPCLLFLHFHFHCPTLFYLSHSASSHSFSISWQLQSHTPLTVCPCSLLSPLASFCLPTHRCKNPGQASSRPQPLCRIKARPVIHGCQLFKIAVSKMDGPLKLFLLVIII